MAAPRKPKRASAPKDVSSTAHDDRRLNIPTADLADFVGEQHRLNPPGRYERDRTLDPQLMWAGKDEQDLAEYLSVTTVPIYIQEKIQPQALIENLRDTAGAGEEEPELTLFDDFNGLESDQTVEFYEHDVNWSNRMILGDALLVMNSLAEKENLRGKVQTIYVDPPYGIKFGSNWQVSARKREVSDGRPADATRQPEQVKAFRDTWELGIHSYLSYLRDRLMVARELLTESGSCFVQIGDENVHLVRALMDEVFGSDNFVSLISFVTTTGFQTTDLARAGDYLLWYSRDRARVKVRQLLYEAIDRQGYRWLETADGSRRSLTNSEVTGSVSLPEGSRLYTPGDLTSQGSAPSPQPFEHDGRAFTPAANSHWKAAWPDGMAKLAAARRIHVAANSIRYVRFADDFPLRPFTNLWTDTGTGNFTDPKTYVVQTNTKVVERCILMTTDPGDLVLDPTCGSGTTTYVAEQWGRRWVTVDTSRVALALARTRLICGRFPYYLLSDSDEGARKEAELSGQVSPAGDFLHDVKKGFVYKRVPHVTLKSIAQNPDIKEGMSREEIDAAIARHADTELLVDQPYEDRKRVRVTGRFTVESLSPHRNLPGENVERTGSEQVADTDAAVGYEQTIFDNLRRAGVHNTFKGEHIKFDRLDVLIGEWLQAEGEFTDAKGESRTVAVSLGPEHGTVSGDDIKEAAREALRGRGFDLLLICGFAFEARSAEVAKEFQPSTDGFATAIDERKHGKLPVLRVNMNPDLAMGGDLLKKTGAGNLFMVFGEPDIDIRKEDAGVVVQLHGLDVYDPTTGAVRSASTDDVMAWFIDTNYNGDAFYVRHAYFTGTDDPYQKLRRDLKAEISEKAWATLYSTTSRPFPAPETGRIAIKVINHFGDEVLQVYDLSEPPNTSTSAATAP